MPEQPLLDMMSKATGECASIGRIRFGLAFA